MVSTGPLSVPLFLFYGLTKGAFLATEAASSLGLYFSKSVTFERFGALTPDVALKGLIAGSSLMFGAFIAKRFVLHLKPDVFRLLMDGIMLAAGVSLLWTAVLPKIRPNPLARPEPIAVNRRPSDACHSHSVTGRADQCRHRVAFTNVRRIEMIRGIIGAVVAVIVVRHHRCWAAGTPSIRPSAACCCATAP